MVPSTPLSEIHLTDGQFLGIIDQSVASESDAFQPPILRGYHTITIIYNHFQNDLARVAWSAPYPGAKKPKTPMLVPKQLNLVIVDERIADIREVMTNFKTSRKSISSNFHEPHLVSLGLSEDSNISIIVWNGRLCTVSSSSLPLGQPLTPAGFDRADLYINHWIEPESVNDIPWIFGQLCRNARPHTLGFHLLSQQGSALTDLWHVQKEPMGRDNTLLRSLNVSGISSDGFLRLLQCAGVEIWCIRELRIIVENKQLADKCFWDWRIFEKSTWPVCRDGFEGNNFLDDGDLRDFVMFPKLALGRLVGGEIQMVGKERMEVRCQIANFGPQSQVEWHAGAGIRNDIECYAGRSLRWMSLALVEVNGEPYLR